MDERLAVGAEGEGRDDLGVGGTGQLVALLGEAAYVVAEIFALLLPAVAEVPGIPRANVRALEIADEDMAQVGLVVDPLRGQVIEPSPS